jgi:peroxiredoxin
MSLINIAAPDFTLFNSERQPVTLSTNKGSKVLLLFFPAAFTSTCTKELCSVRDDLSLYNDLNAKVFGISTDSLYSLAKYKEELSLNFDLLADFNKEVSELYNALYEEFAYGMKGVSKRAAFVIDEEGIVKYEEVLQLAGDIPDFGKIKATLS